MPTTTIIIYGLQNPPSIDECHPDWLSLVLTQTKDLSYPRTKGSVLSVSQCLSMFFCQKIKCNGVWHVIYGWKDLL